MHTPRKCPAEPKALTPTSPAMPADPPSKSPNVAASAAPAQPDAASFHGVDVAGLVEPSPDF
eukprot:11345181-Alexandrium_andersonii.AAC.1